LNAPKNLNSGVARPLSSLSRITPNGPVYDDIRKSGTIYVYVDIDANPPCVGKVQPDPNGMNYNPEDGARLMQARAQDQAQLHDSL